MLIEGVWAYRFNARVRAAMLERTERVPKAVRDITWKAQVRLCGRYRRLAARSKRLPVVATAVAREMSAFLWAIGQVVAPREVAP